MSVTKRSVILGIILSILAALLYYISISIQKTKSSSFMDDYPTFSATNFKSKSYDKSGQLYLDFKALNINYYDKQDKAVVTRPDLLYHEIENNKVTDKIWSMHADNATIYKNEKINASGNILFKPLFEHSIINVKANTLDYNLKDNTISTNDFIRIKGQNYENSGYNFKADLNTNIVSIKGSPNAIYQNNN